MAAPRITAEYLVETPIDLAEAAASMAGEQSTGTFTRVPGETDELRERFSARVEEIELIEERANPSLPGARQPATNVGYQYGRVRISFSLENVGNNLPTIIATVAGNLFELRQLSGLRLADISFPDSLASCFAGPRFGINGTREIADVHGRPIIGTIVKPSVGLSPESTADLVTTLGDSGIDFIKDDELMANPPHSPLSQRVESVMSAINRIADKSGKKVMYAFNISDQLDEMLRHHDTVMNAGGSCVMVSLNSVGHVAVDHLRRNCKLAIHGHRNGWGMFHRCPSLGMEFTAYQKLWRLAGVDHLHVNGLQNKFCESDESVVRSVKACLTPMLGGYQAMPVISSGQWGGQAPETYRQTQTLDLMYLAGGGIMGHPGGPKAGVAAIQQAWQAASTGIPLTDYAATHRELRQSLDYYGEIDHAKSRD